MYYVCICVRVCLNSCDITDLPKESTLQGELIMEVGEIYQAKWENF